MYANKCIARLISVYFCILFSQWHNTIFNDLFFTVYMTLNTKKSPDYRRINIPPWLDGANAAAEPTREAIAAIFIMVRMKWGNLSKSARPRTHTFQVEANLRMEQIYVFVDNSLGQKVPVIFVNA